MNNANDNANNIVYIQLDDTKIRGSMLNAINSVHVNKTLFMQRDNDGNWNIDWSCMTQTDIMEAILRLQALVVERAFIP